MADPGKNLMEKFRETFWSWVVQQVEKRSLFKKWLLTQCLESSRAHTGYQPSSFLQPEAEIDSCFERKVEFYNPPDEYDLKKTFYT